MANFIEFTTQHDEPTYGNPIHDGKQPKRFGQVDGILVDGQEIEFLDQTIPNRMQRYFSESRKLRRRGIVNDCVAFVALMNSLKLKDRQHNPFSQYDKEA